MKRFFGVGVVVFLFGVCSIANAQNEVNAVGDEIKKGGRKAGNKTAEVASKGKSKVVDKTYKDKVGPNGETIYIDKHSKYYWIDDKGHKHYVVKSQLQDKSSQ